MSINRTKSFSFLTEQGFTLLGQLFLPAKWSRWWRLALISASIGGFMNISVDMISNIPEAQAAPYSIMTADMPMHSEPSTPDTAALQAAAVHWLLTGEGLEHWVFPVITGLMLFLVLTVDYFQARFRFVILDVISTKDVAIIAPYKKHKRLAHSFFKWLFALRWGGYGLWAFAIYLTISGWRDTYAAVDFVAEADFLSMHSDTMALQFLFFISTLMLMLSGLSIFFYVARAYAIPIMFHNNVPFKTAYSTSLSIIRKGKVEALKNLGWRLLMMVVASITVSLIAVVLFILCVVPMVIFIYLATMAPVILAFVLIPASIFCFFLLIFLYFLLSGLPQYWARAFDMFYLQSLNEGYDFMPYCDKDNHSKS